MGCNNASRTLNMKYVWKIFNSGYRNKIFLDDLLQVKVSKNKSQLWMYERVRDPSMRVRDPSMRE